MIVLTAPARFRPRLSQLEDRSVPATHTYTNAGATFNWSEPANWDAAGVPTTGEAGGTIVTFPGAVPSNQDIVGLVIARINFTSGGNSVTVVTPLGINGGAALTNIQNTTGSNTITGGTINLSGANAFIQVDAGTLTVASAIAGNQGFRKLGTGTLELTTAVGNTYTGTTNVAEGTLLLNTNTADAGLSGAVVVGDNAGAADSAVLQFGANSFEIPDTATLTINPDGRVNVPGGITEDVTTLTVNGGQMNVAGTGVFEIQPNGTVASNGAAGSVIDGTGNLRFQSGSITFDVVNGAGATDLLVATPITQQTAANLVKTGAGTLEFSMQAPNTYTGTTTIADGVLLLNTTTLDAGLSGTIMVGDNAGSAVSAVLRLPNTFEIADAASVTVYADGLIDVLATGNEDVTVLTLGSATGGGSVAVAAGGRFAIRPAGAVNAAAAPTGSTISGPGTFGLLAATTFTVADGAAAQDLIIGAVITGATLGLTKAGAGTLRLTGDNTYTGTTAVTSGTLQVDGSQGGSAVSVTAGTLGGSGTVGPITTNGGTLAPGLLAAVVPVTLRSGNLVLAGVTFAPLLSGTPGGAADRVAVTGSVNLTGAALAVTRVGAAVPAGLPRVLISNDGTDPVVGTFAGLPQGALVTVAGQMFAISYTGGDGNDVVLTLPGSSTTLGVSGQANGTAGVFVPGAAGQYGASPAATLSAFPSFGGNVRTATADVNGDGTEDTVLVTGPGTPIRLAVISGADNTTVLVAPFDPFGGDFAGGGFVAAADLDTDGRAEFVVTPDQGGGPRVSIFSLTGGAAALRANFFGIDDASFRGGARAALGDVNKDGTPDLAVSAGFLGGPRTALFNGTTLFGTPTRLVGDFFAFAGTDAVTLRNGVFVAAGDVDGDGSADLIFGGGPGGAPRVFILSGALISAGEVAAAQNSPIANFFVANNSSDRGGVRVAAKNADGDARADVATGSGEASPGRVRVYLGSNFTGTGEPATFQDLGVAGGQAVLDGVFVG